MHRELLPSRVGQPSLFETDPEPTIICRKSRAKERIEWQADFFAACLLMPRSMVLAAWQSRFGHSRTRVVQTGDEMQRMRACRDVAVRFADTFLVSVEAMRIRLEQLHLLEPGPRAQPLLRPVS